jgi:hypothetical protein
MMLTLFGAGSEPLPPEAELEWRFWNERNQCAAWAVFHALALSGVDPSVDAIDALLPADGNPKSLLQFRDALHRLGLPSRAVRIDSSQLAGSPYITILPLKHDDAEPKAFTQLTVRSELPPWLQVNLPQAAGKRTVMVPLRIGTQLLDKPGEYETELQIGTGLENVPEARIRVNVSVLAQEVKG